MSYGEYEASREPVQTTFARQTLGVSLTTDDSLITDENRNLPGYMQVIFFAWAFSMQMLAWALALASYWLGEDMACPVYFVIGLHPQSALSGSQ